jgi:hypothetical protein
MTLYGLREEARPLPSTRAGPLSGPGAQLASARSSGSGQDGCRDQQDQAPYGRQHGIHGAARSGLDQLRGSQLASQLPRGPGHDVADVAAVRRAVLGGPGV